MSAQSNETFELNSDDITFLKLLIDSFYFPELNPVSLMLGSKLVNPPAFERMALQIISQTKLMKKEKIWLNMRRTDTVFHRKVSFDLTIYILLFQPSRKKLVICSAQHPESKRNLINYINMYVNTFLFLFFMSFCPCAIPSQHIISRCITKFDGYKEVWTDEKYSYRCQEM